MEEKNTPHLLCGPSFLQHASQQVKSDFWGSVEHFPSWQQHSKTYFMSSIVFWGLRLLTLTPPRALVLCLCLSSPHYYVSHHLTVRMILHHTCFAHFFSYFSKMFLISANFLARSYLMLQTHSGDLESVRLGDMNTARHQQRHWQWSLWCQHNI